MSRKIVSLSSQGTVRDTSLEEALSTRYLSYALSTITSRSLPDVRDGLKPVQRRILYAMKESGNTYDKSYKKSASSVGYVMMKYHPHGNDPIYEAMVRLAQDFSTRYPLVDGQGNFGSIDGDNAAAMRYTEARLTLSAAAMLEGIDEQAVDYQESYNNETFEPKVLPAAFPNLLANGSMGIAVGMATNIPPHNVGEICDALLHLIRHPLCDVAQLMSLLPGPDFPTGGIIVEDAASLRKTYETGRGSIRMRARYEVEDLKAGLYQIVITEIPYQIQKSRLIEKIADLILDKKIPLLTDIRDESTTDVRIVLTPRNRTVEADILMETLFRLSDLDTRFSVNMNVLDQGRFPKVMSLREVLQAFLSHRKEVLCRRAQHRLTQIDHRLEVLEGYRIAYLNLDDVIKLIREEDDPKVKMIARWKLTEVQAEAILNMRLRALRKLEEIQILEELQKLADEKNQLILLLAQEGQQWQKITEEIKKIKKNFGPTTVFGKRRSSFLALTEREEIPLDAMIEREPVTIVCSEKGWIRTLKGHTSETSDLKYKEGDTERFILLGETTDKLMIWATNGRMYTVGVDKLPGGRGHGEPLRLMVDLPNDEDILSLFILKSEHMNQQYLVASQNGYGFLIKGSDLTAQTRSGKQILNLATGQKALICMPAVGDTVAIIGTHRKMLIFKLDEIPELTRGRGVILQRYKDSHLSDIKIFAGAEGLSWRSGERMRVEKDIRPWTGTRAQMGKLPPTGFPRNNRF
ncbi:MAG: DNA topoisomerase IV subunit A [Janthinobacterium lividum]